MTREILVVYNYVSLRNADRSYNILPRVSKITNFASTILAEKNVPEFDIKISEIFRVNMFDSANDVYT
jgi:hypothetical protein